MSDLGDYVPLSARQPRLEHLLTDEDVERILRMLEHWPATLLRRHMMAAERAAYEQGKASRNAT